MRNLTRGEVVEPDQKLFTVADLSDVWVIANVPEKDVTFIKKDQTVDMVAAAYPHALFSGTITYVGDVLDPATRTMRVRITAPNPHRLLKPEMFALVVVIGKSDPLMSLSAKDSPGILTATLSSKVIYCGRPFRALNSNVSGPGQNLSMSLAATSGTSLVMAFRSATPHIAPKVLTVSYSGPGPSGTAKGP
jgi:hypothetical protein